ncbi:uncharacterized protein LOC143604309 [Bidens hawaiensis]|uniref:uncharacterized protein LOC143604309 n=1 Tax=Bidens hawaiensis TaxID=980011 RepID=UPI00404B0788
MDRVPVLSLLTKRNIRVDSMDCPACGLMEETTEHIFVSCGLAQSVWLVISTWCKVPQLFAFSVCDIVESYKYSKFSKRKAKAFHAVCLVTLWCLWKARKDMVHNGSIVTVGNVVEEVKALSYLWVKNRSSGSSLSRSDWEKFGCF